MRQPISMVRGTTQNISISLYDQDDSPYELQEGEVLRLGVKSCPNNKSYELSKEVTVADDSGVYTFILSPSDTIECEFGMHYYDVGLQSGSDYYNIVECSPFEILYNITEADNYA